VSAYSVPTSRDAEGSRLPAANERGRWRSQSESSGRYEWPE